MKQKLKQLLKIGILIFGISLFNMSCSHENETEIELTETQQIQSVFTLENFDDVFVKNNLQINWNDFIVNPNPENGLVTYEFNTYFNIKSTIGDYFKYKLLASRNEPNDWNFEIIRLSMSKENLNNLSYFSLNNFSGSIYHYDLNGENTLIKVYDNGKIIEEISIYDFENGNADILAKAPPIGGGHCEGCWTLVRTSHYTDWYTNSGGGSSLYYSYSTYNGSSTEWAYIPPNNNYYGMPYDPINGTYHNHYDQPHGGGRTNNHKNEKIEKPVEIINKLTGEKEKCINDLLTKNGTDFVQELLNNFKGKSEFDIIIKSASTLTNPITKKESAGLTWPPNSKNQILIEISSSSMVKRSALEAANVILHEYIHADIHRKLLTKHNTTQEVLDFRNTYNKYKEQYKDKIATTQHQTMANLYLNSMRDALKAFHKNVLKSDYEKYIANMGHEPTELFYEALAWRGLKEQNVEAYKDLKQDKIAQLEKLDLHIDFLTKDCHNAQ